ncbi:MAG: DUF6101 family protein [Pseudomonadota bacterium]
MSANMQPIWAGHEFRLDPTRLPQRMSYAARIDGAEVDITVSERGATLKKRLDVSGLPLNIALPNKAFRGVAARAAETGPESAIVTLELLHEDENLCVPLRVGHELGAIVKDWQLWAEILNLPMMIIDSDGVARTLDESAAKVITGKNNARRHHAMFANRRPRFLARRRLGNLGVRVIVEGEEIIARDCED